MFNIAIVYDFLFSAQMMNWLDNFPEFVYLDLSCDCYDPDEIFLCSLIFSVHFWCKILLGFQFLALLKGLIV